MGLKEDYDMTLQHLNRYRKVLRANKFWYDVKQVEQSGGCAVYRDVEREREQFVMLQRKWGEDIVREDSLNSSRSHQTKKKRTLDINPILHEPIKGV